MIDRHLQACAAAEPAANAARIRAGAATATRTTTGAAR